MVGFGWSGFGWSVCARCTLKGWAPLPLEVGAVGGMASLGDPACSSALGDPVPGAVGRLSPVVRTLWQKNTCLEIRLMWANQDDFLRKKHFTASCD